MKTYMYAFECPHCGAKLLRFVTDQEIGADSQIILVCDAGCGNTSEIKPSQGARRGS